MSTITWKKHSCGRLPSAACVPCGGLSLWCCLTTSYGSVSPWVLHIVPFVFLYYSFWHSEKFEPTFCRPGSRVERLAIWFARMCFDSEWLRWLSICPRWQIRHWLHRRLFLREETVYHFFSTKSFSYKVMYTIFTIQWNDISVEWWMFDRWFSRLLCPIFLLLVSVSVLLFSSIQSCSFFLSFLQLVLPVLFFHIKLQIQQNNYSITWVSKYIRY